MNRDLACFVPMLGDYEGRKASRALRDYAVSRAVGRDVQGWYTTDGDVAAEVRAILSMRAGRLLAGVRR